MLQIEYHNLPLKKSEGSNTFPLHRGQCQKADYFQGPLEFHYLRLTCVKYSHYSCFK